MLNMRRLFRMKIGNYTVHVILSNVENHLSLPHLPENARLPTSGTRVLAGAGFLEAGYRAVHAGYLSALTQCKLKVFLSRRLPSHY